MRSQTLATALESVNPGWGSDDMATAVLYSGRQTRDGSSSSYTGQVHQMSLGIGGHNEGADGVVHC